MPQSSARRSLHDLTFAALEGELVKGSVSPAHARALWRTLHREGATDLHAQPDFPPPLRKWLNTTLDAPDGFHAAELAVADERASTDGQTRKFLLRLDDGQTIETVLMGYPGRFTACVSTQAGCAMGCVFCATGQMGFVRHLRAGEIVAQVLRVQRTLHQRGAAGLRNLVLMGMGEPLHNYDAVMTALEIITDRRGINLAPSHVTISTVGVVSGILRMAEERRPFHLAVSLHATTEEERLRLVPATRRWPLAELLEACREYGRITGRRIFFEWALIAGANDSPAQAERLAKLLAGLDAHVNLIPLNATNGFAGAASNATAVQEFSGVLREAGFPVTVRQRRGIDVSAGCGQLQAAHSRRAP